MEIKYKGETIKLKDINFITGETDEDIRQFKIYLTQKKIILAGNFNYLEFPMENAHPKKQVEFGKHLFSYKEKNYIIRTHNDFIIDGFRLAQNKSEKPRTAQLLFFEEGKIIPIEIESDGSYSKTHPKNFRMFEIYHQMDLLSMD